jgi:signal transduction histidine kinase
LIFSALRYPVVFVVIPAVVIQAAALWWRRSHPAAVLLAVVACGVITWVALPDREPGGPALVFAVYALSVYDGGRVRPWIAGAAIALIAVAVGVLLLGQSGAARSLLPAGATSLVAWVIGDYVRSRRRFVDELMARHRQEREKATEEERLRIARELHDVVAHNVSAMAIQAGAARVAGADSREALADIEQSARATLSELNKLLGVLRKTNDAPLAPQPTLADAETLLRPARDAGLAATLKITGAALELPAAVELSAYRIVQEAITNVLKHANASRVEVTIDYGATALNLTIADNGGGASPNGPVAASSGHGLIGMRERVALFGGDLSTGSSSLGGFVVRATLPVKDHSPRGTTGA